MARWRVVLDLDHPDASDDEVSAWVQMALNDTTWALPGLYAAVDELERMDTAGD